MQRFEMLGDLLKKSRIDDSIAHQQAKANSPSPRMQTSGGNNHLTVYTPEGPDVMT